MVDKASFDWWSLIRYLLDIVDRTRGQPTLKPLHDKALAELHDHSADVALAVAAPPPVNLRGEPLREEPFNPLRGPLKVDDSKALNVQSSEASTPGRRL